MPFQATMDVPFIPARPGFKDAQLYLFTAAFAAGNLLLPMAVHALPNGGPMLLPLYFFTLVAAYGQGLWAGALVALASPLLNHAVTGLPPAALLPVVLGKSLLLAAAAAAVSRRLGRISLAALAGLALAMQAAGALLQWAWLGDPSGALHDAALGLPGVALMALGGYAVLRALAAIRGKGGVAR